MSQKNSKQTLFETLSNEGIITDSQKHFRQFLRIKDGNEDEPETEIGENFEILLQFVLDCRQLPAAEAIEKYFVADSTLSLSNNALRKELKSGSKDPEKLKEAEDDVKNKLRGLHDAWIETLYENGTLEDRSDETIFNGFKVV